MLILECLFPLSQKQATCGGKNPRVTIHRKETNTCAELATAISKRIQTLCGREACQTSTHVACQVHSLSSHLFDCLVRDLNYGPWLVTPTLMVSIFFIHNFMATHSETNRLTETHYKVNTDPWDGRYNLVVWPGYTLGYERIKVWHSAAARYFSLPESRQICSHANTEATYQGIKRDYTSTPPYTSIIGPIRCTICFRFNTTNSLYMFRALICSLSGGTVYTVKGKVFPLRPEQAQTVDRGIAPSFLDPGARRGWMVSTMPWPLYPRERPGTHDTGGWVGPRAGLDVCIKFRPHWDSIPGPSSP
jgi:hypothetical protein